MLSSTYHCQTTTPDHYYDFSKVKSINGVNYVFDQITKDDRTAFGFLPERKCPKGSSTWPIQGPDGLQFSQKTDSLRLENSNNLQLTNKFLIAVWVKLPYCQTSSDFCQKRQNSRSMITYYCRQERFFTQTRFDQDALQSTTVSLGVEWQTDKLKFATRINAPSVGSSLNALSFTQHPRYMVVNSTLHNAGWYLLAFSADSSNPGTLIKFSLRIRGGPTNGYDNYLETLNNFAFYDPDSKKSDTYIGAYCQSQSHYQSGSQSTIGRLYIWKSFANVDRDNQFDRFFFRSGNAVLPKCSGLIPCSFCVIGQEQLTTSPADSLTLKCTTEANAADPKKMLLTHWDFDDETNITKYIYDKSGNGFNLMKEPLDDSSSKDVFRIYGQGYMFYGDSYLKSVNNANFYNFPQFTIEAWIRRYQDTFTYPTTNQAAGLFRIVDDTDSTLLEIFIDQEGSGFVIQDLAGQRVKPLAAAKIFLTTNTSDQIDSKSSSLLKYSDTARLKISNKRTMIYKSIKIYSYAQWFDETNNTFSRTCTKVGNQGVCDVCPLDTKKCLSACNQNQYGLNCADCHKFCGHCTGPNITDCVYCNRDGSSINMFHSNAYGNCSCISGYYYNSTTDQCEQCHANCKSCFGQLKSQCFSCQSAKDFHPPYSCVDDCSDDLVVNGTSLGFFERSETINGNSVKFCSKCHPYCKQCYGDMNSDCNTCQPDYYIKATTCYDVCPSGFQANQATKLCEPCHADCKICSGPLKNQCLQCTDSTLYQQNGKCLANCDDGFYPDGNKQCQECNKACAICTSKFASDCTACKSGYYLEWLGTTCKTYCDDGYYPDSLTNQCLMCHYSCGTCTGAGPAMCQVCAPGYLKSGLYCVTECKDSEYIVNGTCRQCDPKCLTCFGISENQCNSCAENLITSQGYFKYESSCLEKCPDGYYQDNLVKICRKCKPECATCLTYDFCTSCIYGPYQLNDGECTYFTCLDNQYRAIKPQLSCFECDSSCKTCQGESEFDCLSCNAEDKFVAQQCLSCNQQPGMTEPIDDSVSGCVEICGDGFNYGSYQCDDGNLINGDGCSSICIIEQGFNCTTGTKFTPSVCMDNKNPTPRISLIASNNYIYIEFDEEVILSEELNTTSLDIKIQGSQGNYKFDWRLGDSYKTAEPLQLIVIETSIYQSLKGNEKEIVIVTFQSSSIYKDPTGNGMNVKPMYAYLNKYDYIDPETKAKLNAAGDTSMLATFGAVAINLAISLVFGGSISAMWTMVNTIQLISLLPLCNVNYPPITLLIFEKMLGSHGESTIIPNFLYDKLIARPGSQVIIEPALNHKFDTYGWQISNFIYLSGRKIIIWTLIIVAYPFVWYMKNKYSDKHKLCKLWVGTEQKFRYTLLLRGVIMSYVSMYLAFVLGIFQMNLTTMENTISAFTAIAFGIILTYLPILLMNILQKNYEKIQSDKFMLSYSTVVKEVDLSHPIRYMYYPVFLLRRAVFSISLVLFAEKPQDQIIFMSMTAIVMMVYVILIKPQKDRVMIILTAYGEGLILFLHIFSSLFLDDNLSEEKSNLYGWLVIVIIGLYILTNWTVIIIITVIQMKQNWKDYKEKKKSQKIKTEEDMEYKKWKKKRQIKKRIDKEIERQSMLDKFEKDQLGQSMNITNNLLSPIPLNKNKSNNSQMSLLNLPDYSYANFRQNSQLIDIDSNNIFNNQALIEQIEEEQLHSRRSNINSKQISIQPKILQKSGEVSKLFQPIDAYQFQSSILNRNESEFPSLTSHSTLNSYIQQRLAEFEENHIYLEVKQAE
ncbi:fu domain containing protein [Stylonychia lemnae]|uniref:Fu domain containing protein n=1 Tax=Stylonychia lemnae TaxID=5949 RepID=A0A078BCD2_STYLE|nr:fu domain containing protein [Stylonychia lemnae]|eukprot:CDW91263.1 fu domain containing protein [Stylonychia lemnae]